MKRETPAPEELRRLEQAAEWVLRLQEAESVNALEGWLDWCARDVRNQYAFEQMAKTWEATSAGAVSRPPRSRFGTALAAGIAAVLGIALAASGWMQRRHEGGASPSVIVAPQGGYSHAELPDGSVLELGARTEARVTYSNARRRVGLLGGQMFVTVAVDRTRPFVVEAGTLQIAALGTAFDVRHEAGRTVVTVIEGQVDVRTGNGGAAAGRGLPVRLASGQQLSYLHGVGPLPVRQVDVVLGTAWRSGVLAFVDEPMPQVIAIINRYAMRPVVMGDRQVAEMTFTGTAYVDRIDYWLAALPEALPVMLRELPDGYLLQAASPRTGSSTAPP